MTRKSIFQLMREAKKAKPSTCEKCHESLDVSWVVCPHCGMPVEDMKQAPKEENKNRRRWNRLNEAEEDVSSEEEAVAEDEVEEELPAEEEPAEDEESQEETAEVEDVSVNDVLDAVEGLLADTGIQVTNSYEKAALCFDLESEEGDAHVVYDGRSVQIYGVDDGELLVSMQAETLPDMLDALIAGLSEEESVPEVEEKPEEAQEGEEKSEEEEEPAKEEKEAEKAAEEPTEEGKPKVPAKEEKAAPKVERKSFKNLIKKRK